MTAILPETPYALSFEAIYLAYHAAIEAHIYRLVNHHEEAKDLTQETFLRAYRAMPGMDLRTLRLGAWLFRIATNAAYDALRHRKHLSFIPWDLLDYEPADDASADCEESIAVVEDVRRTLAQLTADERAYLYRSDSIGGSVQECAATFGIGVNAYKMRLMRARQHFRAIYHREATI